MLPQTARVSIRRPQKDGYYKSNRPDLTPRTPPAKGTDSSFPSAAVDKLTRARLLSETDHPRIPRLQEKIMSIVTSINGVSTIPQLLKITVESLDSFLGMELDVDFEVRSDILEDQRPELKLEDTLPNLMENDPKILAEMAESRRLTSGQGNNGKNIFAFPMLDKEGSTLLGALRISGQEVAELASFERFGTFVNQVLNQMVERAHLERAAVTDGLTGLYNRKYLDGYISNQFENRRRYNDRPIGLLIIDIDHFKNVNDKHGHPTGDEVLRRVAKIVKSQTRKADMVARYGGEELAVVCPETGINGAASLAEKIRAAVEGTPISYDGKSINLTISVGVAAYDKGMKSEQALIDLADANLYTAKETGRNKVIF